MDSLYLIKPLLPVKCNDFFVTLIVLLLMCESIKLAFTIFSDCTFKVSHFELHICRALNSYFLS